MSAEFPFTGSVAATNPTTLPMFREYAWDFNNDRFERDSNGNMILLEGNEAIKIWLYKVFKTERFMYLAYSSSYGIEINQFMGRVLSVGERKSEMRRVIKECIMVLPYISSIDKIEFNEDERGRVVAITVELTTIYGKMTV